MRKHKCLTKLCFVFKGKTKALLLKLDSYKTEFCNSSILKIFANLKDWVFVTGSFWPSLSDPVFVTQSQGPRQKQVSFAFTSLYIYIFFMPQLDKVSFLSQFFWLCVFFFGFYSEIPEFFNYEHIYAFYSEIIESFNLEIFIWFYSKIM